MDCECVIFLDIDGVLATMQSIFMEKKSKEWIVKYDAYPFDKGCVEVLNEILENTNSEIVLSSSWQKSFSLEEIADIFKINGVKKAPIDFTREVKVKLTHDMINNQPSVAVDRVVAIKKYLNENTHIQRYVVVDDMPMYGDFPDGRFICCPDGHKGIKEVGIKEKIILSLNYQ